MTVEQHEPTKRTDARTRLSGLWVALGCFALILLFLLIFILRNDTSVRIWFFGAQWQLPLGVALSLAAVFGVLLVVIPAAARIVQLRVVDRRHQRTAAVTAKRDAEPPTAVAPVPEERPAEQRAWPQPQPNQGPPNQGPPPGQGPPHNQGPADQGAPPHLARPPQAPQPSSPTAWSEPENRQR